MLTKDTVAESIKTILDPDLFIDIWTLGLIYDIKIDDAGKVDIEMTFTSIACPSGPMLVEEVKAKTKQLPGVTDVNVKVVFSPPWEPSEELKGMLGIG